MFMDPKKAVFTSVEDLVDYVEKGLPPTKSDFEQVIEKIKMPNSVADPTLLQKTGKEVIVTDLVVKKGNAETIEAVLNRIYENRRSRYKTGLIAVAVIGILGALAYFGIPKLNVGKKEEAYDPFEDDFDEYEEDYEDEE